MIEVTLDSFPRLIVGWAYMRLFITILLLTGALNLFWVLIRWATVMRERAEDPAPPRDQLDFHPWDVAVDATTYIPRLLLLFYFLTAFLSITLNASSFREVVRGELLVIIGWGAGIYVATEALRVLWYGRDPPRPVIMGRWR